MHQNDVEVVSDVVGPLGRYSLTARYLVGCDGSRSQIRLWAAIPFPGVTYPEVNRLGQVVRVTMRLRAFVYKEQADALAAALRRSPCHRLLRGLGPDVYVLAISPPPVRIPCSGGGFPTRSATMDL